LKSKQRGGAEMPSSHLHFPTCGEDHRHLQQEKNAQTVDFNFIFSFSDLVLSPLQIHLISVVDTRRRATAPAFLFI
jgi:hypothetical protein